MQAHACKVLTGTLVLVVAVACAAASANGATGSAECATATSHAARAHSAARTSGIHSYDDYIEDVVSAPDICGSNVVTNDNRGAITIGLHIHDRSAFAAPDGYGVYLDTDSNPATGSVPVAGVPAGAEYEIQIANRTSNLLRWNGSSFELLPTQQPISTEWVEGYGPVLEVNKADLGKAESFSFVFVTSAQGDFDLAPDTGAWSYALGALQLTAGPLTVGAARAGKPFIAWMSVERSDFEIPLDEGTIKCDARLVGGKRIVGRTAFLAENIACIWRLPNNAGGKRFVGGVQVTFQGVTAKRAFSVRVK